MEQVIEHPADGRPDEGDTRRSRIVVGVDGSPGARAVLGYALGQARRRGADLDVVSTYWLEPSYFGGAPLDDVDPEGIHDATQDRARALIDEVRQDPATPLPTGGRETRIRLIVAEGPATHKLIKRSEGADLLVVGSRGRGAIRSLALGSVALHCVTHARCPVVVVHRPPAPADVPSATLPAAGPGPARIVVGVDGSPGSRLALRAALDEATRTGAEVEAVVAAYLVADYWMEPTEVVAPPIEGVRAEIEARTQQLVDEMTGGVADGQSSPRVRIVVIEGLASEVLTRQARGAELLVVGHRGRGAFRGLLLGSVALHCAMHAPCPVMVVRPEPGAASAQR
jgi:nucleotide-binding universal stress UspA family protein